MEYKPSSPLHSLCFYMKKIILLFFVLFNAAWSYGQLQNTTLENIAFYADVAVNAINPEHRIRANEQLEVYLQEFFTQSNSFEVDFNEAVPQIQELELGEYKLYSYLVDIGDNRFETYGYLLHKSGTYQKLTDVEYSQDLSYMSLTNGNWIPGVYYHAIPFETDQDSAYLLFSYTQLDQFTKRKTIDVFIDGDGPQFGSDVFVFPIEGSRNITKMREIYHYSADVVMTIQHQPGSKLILIDHLMQVKSRMPDQGNTMVPDGSYQALELEEGKWVYVNKMYDTDTTVPQESKQEEKKVKRNIFGEIIRN